MKAFFTLLSLLVIASTYAFSYPVKSVSGRQHIFFKKHRPSHKPEDLIVQFKPQCGPSMQDTVIQGQGGTKVTNLSPGFVHIRKNQGKTLDRAMRDFAGHSCVESVQTNHIYHKLAIPNDPQYGLQWGLKNTAQNITSPNHYSTNDPGVSGKDIGVESAWNTITDCSAAIIAVIDTGINYTHQDLATNMWTSATYPNHGYNFVDMNNDPMDLDGHGTHVAGIIGAVGNNGLGTTGVCWRAKLMAVRVLDASGSGSTADIISGVDFAVTNGAKVINLSLGDSEDDPALSSALANAVNQGVTIVAAAGNDSQNNDSGSAPTYPCNYHLSGLICVAALDQAFQLADFSNYGTQSVGVGAPGTNILSTWAGTNTILSDVFHMGTGGLNWTQNGTTWGYSAHTLGDGMSHAMLSNPTNWDGRTTHYADNLDSRVYKNFNLSAYRAAVLEFQVFLDLQANVDYLDVGYKTSGGDPFSSGVLIDQETDTSGNTSTYLTYDLSHCLTTTCGVGFRFTSNANTNSFGAAIFDFDINGLTINSTSYNTIDGTSMATPMVAGVAAMLMAYNPAFTNQDAVRAIQMGGVATSSLAGKTISGNALSAGGALNYIAAPTGVTAVVQ